MSYTLILGDLAYSSWSLRAWLLFERFGIPFALQQVQFGDDGGGWAAIEAVPPAKTVPTLLTPDGAIVHDSLALAEELATRHPDVGLWPIAPKARATARTLAAEMHSSFSALRQDCPMNLRCAYSSYAPPDVVKTDIARLETIWSHAFDAFGGPWLCGAYSAADAFFAPVAMRIAGYGLAVSERAQAYVDAHLSDAAFRRWRAMALVAGPDLARYARDYTQVDWPGPVGQPAEISEGPSVNTHCPFSGAPVAHFLRLDGTVFGFSDAFDRDKVLADPAVWLEFRALQRGTAEHSARA